MSALKFTLNIYKGNKGKKLNYKKINSHVKEKIYNLRKFDN